MEWVEMGVADEGVMAQEITSKGGSPQQIAPTLE